MNSSDTPVPRLVAIDRRQLLLRTVDVEKLVEDGHAVRSIWELVGAAGFALVSRADRRSGRRRGTRAHRPAVV